MLLSEIDNEDLFYFFVETLESKFNVTFSLKADSIDTKYFDFSLKEFHLTLHYQLYVGIELLPMSFFSEEKATKKELEFADKVGVLLLNEKRKIEDEFKNYFKEIHDSKDLKNSAINQSANTPIIGDERVVDAYLKGMNYDEIVAIIGPSKQFKTLNQGFDSGIWKFNNIIIAIEFHHLRCTKVSLKKVATTKTSYHFIKRVMFFFILILLYFLGTQVLTFDAYGGMGLLLLLAIGIPFSLGLIYILIETIYLVIKNKKELLVKNVKLIILLIIFFLLLYIYSG